jgi:hypothetical protein
MESDESPVRNASKALGCGFFNIIALEEKKFNRFCNTLEVLWMIYEKVSALKLLQHP